MGLISEDPAPLAVPAPVSAESDRRTAAGAQASDGTTVASNGASGSAAPTASAAVSTTYVSSHEEMKAAAAKAAAIDAEASRQIKIIYASQTGTAEDLAGRIAQIARRRRFRATVVDIADYDVTDLIDEPYPVLFIVATTGLGAFPSSAQSFWRFLLRRDLPADSLADLRAAVLGLGDSSYAKFCWPARLLRRRLQSLAAQEYVLGDDADDQHPLGLEGVLVPFLDKLFAQLKADYPLPENVHEIPDDELLPPEIAVRAIPQVQNGAQGGARKVRSFAHKVPLPGVNGSSHAHRSAPPRPTARLTRNERMTAADHWQDVRMLEFEHARDGAGGSAEDGAALDGMQYEAGDVFCVKPRNSDKHVERFLQRMGWADRREQLVQVELRSSGRKLPPDLPPQMTLHELVKSHLDICSVPRPSFFHAVRPFSPAGSMEREKLDEYCTPGDGADDMFDYAMRVRRTILEVLEEFTSIRFDIDRLCEIVPFMRERQFSIASCADYLQAHSSAGAAQSADEAPPRRLQLAVAIVKYKTRLREPRRGVCTSWLAALVPGSAEAESIPYRIEMGTMHLPKDESTPVLYVGPGTGVAPMRAFIQQRLLAHDASENDEKTSSHQDADSSVKSANRIYLGFRHSQKDFLFGDEWQRWSARGLLAYRLAASRESEAESGSKTYVQDLLQADSVLVWSHIGERGGYVLISGSSGKMPEAVRAALKDACVKHGGMDDEQADRFLQAMETQGRLQEECWS